MASVRQWKALIHREKKGVTQGGWKWKLSWKRAQKQNIKRVFSQTKLLCCVTNPLLNLQFLSIRPPHDYIGFLSRTGRRTSSVVSSFFFPRFDRILCWPTSRMLRQLSFRYGFYDRSVTDRQMLHSCNIAKKKKDKSQIMRESLKKKEEWKKKMK